MLAQDALATVPILKIMPLASSLIRSALLAAFVAFPAQAFDLQGHRGARGLAPENTLPAYRRALELGVDTLECDMAITKDGVVVIHHDLWLNPDTTRGPDGKWLEARGPAIHELTFEALQQYDVGRLKPGSDYAKSFPDQQAVDGTRIPRLADLFDLVRKSGNASVGFDCETKISPLEPGATLPPDEFARKVIAEIREGGMQRRMMVQSFDWRTLQLIQKEAPEIRTMYLTSPNTLKPAAGNRRRRGSTGSLPSCTGARSRRRSTPRAARSGRPIRAISHRPCWPRRIRWASWSFRGPSTIRR